LTAAAAAAVEASREAAAEASREEEGKRLKAAFRMQNQVVKGKQTVVAAAAVEAEAEAEAVVEEVEAAVEVVVEVAAGVVAASLTQHYRLYTAGMLYLII
jgi:hypothetical protein